MNRLLQHFVDSGGSQGAPAARPPIPAPPQSSGGSYHAGNRGSYQRAAPGGPFYYQPPPPSGFEVIPLTSQSTGAMYETVDLNADNSQQLWGHRPPSSREGNRQQAPGSASELFASGPPPARKLSGDNPYRRQSNPTASPFTSATGNVAMLGNATTPPKDLFAASPTQNGGAMFGHAPQKDPFAAQENRNVFGNGAAHDPFAVQPPKDNGFQQQQQQPQRQAVDPFASPSTPSGSSPFDSPAPSNGGYQTADSLFASPAPTNNGEWAQPTQSTQPPVQAQELFASEPQSASSLFGGQPPSTFHPTPPKPQNHASPSPSKPQTSAPPSDQVRVPPSPAKSQTNIPPSPMKPPIASPPSPMINASSPKMKPQVSVPASPVMKPEDHLAPAFGSMKVATPSKSPLRSGLDVRHMKFPTGKREDDAMSNAPSIAPSRMSMLSTLDDSLKLSDMYKQMTARLEGEKHDLLKVVASQAQEIAQMKKHIKSLELQLKKYRPQDA
ncbi:hypothetical protein JG687_00005141 [Phytophthora cactorum]|uniref:Uncharacterized protein n=1 Tax=Phytophthora cactorum TaxID=29920 RepID=A0A8T1URA3_9STRA|nr:hypothetical protein JG687_00005141 [Phytophthora cactorum]